MVIVVKYRLFTIIRNTAWGQTSILLADNPIHRYSIPVFIVLGKKELSQSPLGTERDE